MKILLESYRAGLFQKKWWLSNFIAGIIVAVVSLPLAMAFAIASGAKPEQGLYTAIVAGLMVSLFGGSRLQIAGPTGAFIMLLANITNQHGIEGLQIATLLAGIMLVLFGIARLGGVIKFIPQPVIIGFTTGIALAILVGQWQYFFGISKAPSTHFHVLVWHFIQQIPNINLPTTIIGLFSLAILLYSNKISYFKKMPSPLSALVLATIVQSIFHFKSVATIGSIFGEIPRGLPAFHIPSLHFTTVIELLGPAFAIALLSAIEALLSAVVADGMTGTKHHSNQELIGEGIANIVAPLFNGFAATGAITRTATNIKNGGNSPLAGIFHALILTLVVLFLAPLAKNVPLTTLAAILFIVCWNMSETALFIKLAKRSPRSDVVILWSTFFLTVFVDLVVAVNIGVILSILFFLLKMSESVEIKPQSKEQLRALLEQYQLPLNLADDILLYVFDGPFFFGAIEAFEKNLSAIQYNPKIIILQFRWVPFVDITALHMLEEKIKGLQKEGTRVIFVGVTPTVENKLIKAGITDLVGVNNLTKELPHALLTCLP